MNDWPHILSLSCSSKQSCHISSKMYLSCRSITYPKIPFNVYLSMFIGISRVVNNTSSRYWQYQYQYLLQKVLPMPIPIPIPINQYLLVFMITCANIRQHPQETFISLQKTIKLSQQCMSINNGIVSQFKI